MRARLYIRVHLSDGRHPFLEPVYSSNNKIKSFYELVDGKAEHHPEGSYYLRYPGLGSRRSGTLLRGSPVQECW